jgi:hypothetical protein
MKKDYGIFIIGSLVFSIIILICWIYELQHICCDGGRLYYLIWTMIINNVSINLLAFIYHILPTKGGKNVRRPR